MKSKTVVAILAALLGLAFWSCRSPQEPTPVPQPIVFAPVICNNNSCTTNAPATTEPGSTGATCPGQVLSVGINVPTSISIAQGNAYVADATPHGPDGKAFPVGCSPLPPVTWFVSAACKVGDDAAFRTLLAGVSVGTCQLNAVVSGVSSPNKTVQVVQ